MEPKTKPELWPFLVFVAALAFPTAWLKLRIYNFPLQLADLLFLLAAAVWFAAFIARRSSLFRGRFVILLAAYAAAVIISTIFSANPTFSAVKLAGKFYLIGIAFLGVDLIRTADDLRLVIKAWLTGAGASILLSFLGLVLFYFGFDDPSVNVVLHPIYGSLPPGNYRRIEGFFFYPAMLANYLGVTWMLLLLAFTAGWVRLRTFVPVAVLLFIVDAFTLTPGLGGICATTAVVISRYLAEHGRNLAGNVVLAAGILAAAAFFAAASFTIFSNETKTVFDGSITPSHRAVAWKTAFETFLKDPITGRGVGLPVADSRFTDPSGNRQGLTDAHNTYISLLGETGIIGFAAFMAIIGFIVWSLYRMEPKKALYEAVRFYFLLALADAFFFQSLTGSFEDSRHLWLFFGMAVAAIWLNDSAEDVPHLVDE